MKKLLAILLLCATYNASAAQIVLYTFGAGGSGLWQAEFDQSTNSITSPFDLLTQFTTPYNDVTYFDGTFYGLTIDASPRIVSNPGGFGGATQTITTLPAGYFGIAHDESAPLPNGLNGLFHNGSFNDPVLQVINPGGVNGDSQGVVTEIFGRGVGILNNQTYIVNTSDSLSYAQLLTNSGVFGGPLSVVTEIIDFGNTVRGVTFIPTVVPIPAAIWLLGSAFIGLIGLSRNPTNDV